MSDDVKWVLTVPAIWKQPAKQFMREAAYEVTFTFNIIVQTDYKPMIVIVDFRAVLVL